MPDPQNRLEKQDSLPFPPTVSPGTASLTMQESVYEQRVEPRRLPADAPNILIVLMDDAGPGQPSTFGGEINTPTLDRVLGEGIGYNRFHTTALCSPTRASLLTGRNHHRVCTGVITEFANDWDAFSGRIPTSTALVAEVLKDYGYATGGWGKWNNTPAIEAGPTGPFENWPTSRGFEYFYGFLAGESSQFEPNLVRNTTFVLPTKTPEEGYHLNEDLADDAITWLHKHKAMAPDRPFFMYWASGAIHGPHHAPKDYIDKYRGKFDDGWDAYRERVFERAKEKGWIPPETELTPRHEQMASWDRVPESERPFQARLMEVCAAYGEHADVQAGRIVDEIEALGYGDNTLIFYIWGDNGTSAQGQEGTISELVAHNGIVTTIEQQPRGARGAGRPRRPRRPQERPHLPLRLGLGRQHAVQGHDDPGRLLRRHPEPDGHPVAGEDPSRPHTADPVPPLQRRRPHDLRDLGHHATSGGERCSPRGPRWRELRLLLRRSERRRATQDPVLRDPRQPRHLPRGLDGVDVRSSGPLGPGTAAGHTRVAPDKDTWELYNLDEDWSQAHDLALEMPDKVERLKELFLIEAAKNKALPIGGGLWIPLFHPELRPAPPYTEWTFFGDTVRVPEFSAPALGTRPNVVRIEAVIPADANGVLYKLGGFSGGLTCFVEDGVLCYEYNLFEIRRTKIRAPEKLPTGYVTVEIETNHPEPMPHGPMNVTMKVNDQLVAEGTVPITTPIAFTANECLDFGISLGSPVSLDYYDKAPFKFNGTIERVYVRYANSWHVRR